MKQVHRIFNALLHAWPQKLGALILATLIWLFVSVNDTSITQRSLFVPITVEGLSADSVATGLPDYVEITVSGPSPQVDRLRPENFEAIIDLREENGGFEVPIRVLSPQGVELRRTNPSEVIGTIESVTEKVVPVDPVILGAAPADAKVLAQVEPPEVAVRARASTLARVARVLAPLRPATGERPTTPYAVDTEGRPVPGVTVQPETVTATVSEVPVLVRRTVAVDLETPTVSGFTVTARLEQPQVEVVGPPSQLDELEAVSGTVSLPTEEPQPGGYTLPVVLQLPEGVQSSSAPTATVRLSRPPLE